MAPVIIAGASALWLGDRLSRANVIGSALATAAVLLTITRGSVHVVRTLSFNPGDFILFASQAAWIAYSLFARAVKSDLPPVTVQAGAYAISVAVLVPLSILERPWLVLSQASWAGWLVILYVAGPITLSHVWYYQVLRVLGAGARLGVHEPDAVPHHRAVLGAPGRAGALVPPGRRRAGHRRRGPGQRRGGAAVAGPRSPPGGG